MKIYLVILVLLFIIFHLISFVKTKKDYEILQINNPITNYSEYIKEKYPIVLKNHNNVDNMLSPITIFKKELKNIKIDNNYAYHNKDMLFIFSNKDLKINILNPKEIINFENSGIYLPHLKLNKIKKNKIKIKPVQILLSEGDILYLPRYWHFNIEHNLEFNISFSETPFSLLFTSYQILPYIFNKLKTFK